MLETKSGINKNQTNNTPSNGESTPTGDTHHSDAPRESESRLDDLFVQHETQVANELSTERPKKELSPLERLRQLFIDELIPVVNELREKYAANGLNLQMDVEQLLDGGRDIVIEIQFDGIGMRYNGTALNGAIAFQQTRYNVEDRSGLTASGTALRTRDLDAATFRTFICDRIAHLVQQARKRRR